MIFGREWEDKKVMKEWVGRIGRRESSNPVLQEREEIYLATLDGTYPIKLSFGRSSFLGENLSRELEGETKEEKVNERERAKKKNVLACIRYQIGLLNDYT